MADKWYKYCRAKDFTIKSNLIDVKLGNERSHSVTIEDDGEAYLLIARVAMKSIIKKIPNIKTSILKRNRVTQLIGFRIDKAGHLIGYAWIPKEGIFREEFQFYVRKLAFESDRYEYLLTGEDVE